MEKNLKKCINRLADKFNHRIEYNKDVMIVKSNINEIWIWQEDKYGIILSFNDSNGRMIEQKLDNEDFFNVLIGILRRPKLDSKLMIGTGNLLTIEEWIKEEGEYVRKQVEEFKMELTKNDIKHRDFGGNRIFGEYFRGVLILVDDLCWGKSNVILIKN